MTKPIVDHEPGFLPRGIDQTIQALVPMGVLFRWAGGLCRLHTLAKDQAGPVRRAKGSIVLVPVDADHLVELATEAAVHRKWDGRACDYKVTNCPRGIPAGILARGHWPEFPDLVGIVEAATLDLDGEEISLPGYHAKSGLYVATSRKLPEMKGVAGRAKGRRGIDILKGLLDGFPFVSEADLSASLAAVLTGLLRRSLPAAPMFAISAPTPGTGKTLLAEIVALIATGRRPPVLSLGHDENEFTKRVYGVLLAGDSVLLLDNVVRPLGGEDVLNQLLSQPVLRFRPLGASGMVSAPTNVLVMVTGNNLSVVSDAKRRTCLVRLDAKIERPEQRVFDRDILVETLARRDELIRAALEVSRSYIEAGCPAVDAKPYGSFSDWDRLIRRPLIWYGLPDPLQSSEGLREADPDLECMRLLFMAWRDIYGERSITAAEVSKDALEYSLAGAEPAHPDLRDALQVACGEKINARRLGNWLRYHKDRIIDGVQLVQAGSDGHAKVSSWKVIQL